MPRKNAVPASRQCEMCGRIWVPRNRYQAARNKTCGPACATLAVSRANRGPRVTPTIPCATCGKLVHRPPSRRRRQTAIYCGHSCRSKTFGPRLRLHAGNGLGKKRPGKGLRGVLNPAWKGGVTYRKRRGNYVSVRYVRCPPDLLTMARADGYVMEHRLVMARWIGRPLTRTETVHHIDHKPLNNEQSNLELWPDNRSHKLVEHGRFVEGAANRLFLTDSAQL